MTPQRRRTSAKSPAKSPKPAARPGGTRKAPAAPAPVAPAEFPLRPPTWVRIWAVSLGIVAAAVAVGIGIPVISSGAWVVAIPLAVLVLLAIGLVWRIGGLITTPTPEGELLVRNRAKTFRLARADVTAVRAGERKGRAGTPVAVLVLTDGTEVPVDATMAANFQTALLDSQVAALQAWHQG